MGAAGRAQRKQKSGALSVGTNACEDDGSGRPRAGPFWTLPAEPVGTPSSWRAWDASWFAWTGILDDCGCAPRDQRQA